MKILKLFFIIFFICSFQKLKEDNFDLKNKITKNLRFLIYNNKVKKKYIGPLNNKIIKEIRFTVK